MKELSIAIGSLKKGKSTGSKGNTAEEPRGADEKRQNDT